MKTIFFKSKNIYILLIQLFAICSFAQTTFYITFGGAFHQIGNSIKECQDGGYIIAGTYFFNDDNVNLYIARIHASGTVLWTRIYGGAGMDSTDLGPGMGGFDVIQSADSNFVVSGWIYPQNPQMLLIKINDHGSTLWKRELCQYWAQSVQQTLDGGYICLGDGIGKTNDEGYFNWCRPTDLQGMYVIQTADSNYIFSGSSYNNYNVFLEKYSPSGTQVWSKTFPGKYNNTSNNILSECSGGHIILAIPFDNNSILINTDLKGTIQWTDTLFNITSTSIVQTRDGGFAIGGFFSDSCGLTLIKTDSIGREIWRRSYCAPKPNYNNNISQIKSMHQTRDGGFIMTGFCGTPAGDLEVIVLKTDSLGYIHTTATKEIDGPKAANVFPNPWSTNTTVQFQKSLQDAELSLFNVLGEIIYSKSNINGDQVELERGTIPAGIYFLVTKNKDNSIQCTKMIVVDP